jgi:hypothetical protein
MKEISMVEHIRINVQRRVEGALVAFVDEVDGIEFKQAICSADALNDLLTCDAISQTECSVLFICLKEEDYESLGPMPDDDETAGSEFSVEKEERSHTIDDELEQRLAKDSDAMIHCEEVDIDFDDIAPCKDAEKVKSQNEEDGDYNDGPFLFIDNASSFHEAVELLKEHATQQHIDISELSIIERILAQQKRRETVSRRSVLCDSVCDL